MDLTFFRTPMELPGHLPIQRNDSVTCDTQQSPFSAQKGNHPNNERHGYYQT